jgi:hypothetical protein
MSGSMAKVSSVGSSLKRDSVLQHERPRHRAHRHIVTPCRAATGKGAWSRALDLVPRADLLAIPGGTVRSRPRHRAQRDVVVARLGRTAEKPDTKPPEASDQGSLGVPF